MVLPSRHTLPMTLASKKTHLDCPVCRGRVPLCDFRGDTHLQCPTCQAELVLVLRRNWLYTSICVAAGFLAAYFQGLQNPVFFMCALVYSGVLIIVAAPILAPLFPPKLKRAEPQIQTLRISPK